MKIYIHKGGGIYGKNDLKTNKKLYYIKKEDIKNRIN